MLTIESDSLSFTFENGDHAGEQYTGECYLCSNASCTCNTLNVIFRPVNEIAFENGSETLAYFIEINVRERDVKAEKEQEALRKEVDFAESLASELNEEDWEHLQGLYIDFKYYLSEEDELDNMQTQFPMEGIESETLMVCYHEILPYGEQIFINVDGQDYFVHDAYCVLPKCDCTEVSVGFEPYTEDAPFDNVRDFPMIFFDYKSKKWREDTPGYRGSPPVDFLVSALKTHYPNIHSFLKHRHAKLKRLYKNYRREHLQLLSVPPQQKNQAAPGRNDPCPCGSGKKYKNCCLEL